MPANKALIAKGRSPYAIPSEQLGKRAVFEIHHIGRIVDGGPVYDIDNMSIVTPKRHGIIHFKRGK